LHPMAAAFDAVERLHAATPESPVIVTSATAIAKMRTLGRVRGRMRQCSQRHPERKLDLRRTMSPMSEQPPRALDDEEQSILEAVRQGATDALGAGAAAVEVRWVDQEQAAGKWPEFVLRPTDSAAPVIGFWFWADERQRGNVPIVAVGVGESETGCIGAIGATAAEELPERVTAVTAAFVGGRAGFVAHRAEDSEYEPPPPLGSLTVWISYGSEDGRATGAIRTYLEDPAAFEEATGIRVSENLGTEQAFVGYLAQSAAGSGPRIEAGAGAISVRVRVGKKDSTAKR
jgi:hypothetical protein